MNYQRLYEYRLRDIDQATREEVWAEIARYLYDALGRPERVLDPAAGRGEFIKAIAAHERWAVDRVLYPESEASKGVLRLTADVMEADLPTDHFDAIFVSNFLEHLPSQEAVASFLERMRETLAPGGRIAVLGPNFRYCSRDYFDCADHTLVFTHVAIEEHLYAAGFAPTRVIPRFLPYSFRGVLPPSRALTRLYLKLPVLWRMLGKQFLVVATK